MLSSILIISILLSLATNQFVRCHSLDYTPQNILASSSQEKTNYAVKSKLPSIKTSTLHKSDADIIAAGLSGASGSSSTISSIFNLSKTILGAGVLSLPFGVAVFTDKIEGLYPATALLLVMGLISAYSFYSIGKACHTHSSKSFADAWAKSVDPKTAPALSFIILFKTFFACLAYSIIIGDSFSQILSTFKAPAIASSRTNVILGMTSLVLFPLSCLRKLDALKYTSALGLGGIVYCAIFMAIRYFDRSYASGGLFANDISAALRPSFNTQTGSMWNPMIFVLISLLSTAYVAHYNAPKILVEMKDSSLSNFRTVVSSAFGLAIAVYTAMLWVGYLTFGGHSSGLILNNYSGNDKLATAARIAIGLGIICTYPLTFTALRDSVFDFLKVPEQKRESLYYPMTLGLLSVITGFALILRNVGKVVSFSGALIGSMMIYIIPALMNIGNYHNARKKSPASRADQIELYSNYAMASVGVVVAIIGVILNFKPSGSGGAAH